MDEIMSSNLSQQTSVIFHKGQSDSQATVLYSTQNSNASALKVSQIQRILTNEGGKRNTTTRDKLDQSHMTPDAEIELR